MENCDRLAKARAETADGLGRQRYLGHEHASRSAGRQHALNRRKVNLGFAGAGDAVDKDHVSVGVKTGALNLRERLLLAVGKEDRRLPLAEDSEVCSLQPRQARRPSTTTTPRFSSALMVADMLL